MKKLHIFLSLAAAAAMSLTSCETNDTLGDHMTLGQEVPTCSWEVGSTVCKAGESFSFHGKYTIPEGRTGDYCEVWYRTMRSETAAATVALAGSLSYTKTYSASDTVRAYQPIVRISHSQSVWTNHMYEVDGMVEVSRTLSPIAWANIENWDQERFDSYYPANFAEEFKSEVIGYLTKDSTYYNALRTVYINHPFTNEQFQAMNSKYNLEFPTIDMSGDDQGAGEKSDAWYSTSTASDAAIVGYYYTTIDASGNTIIHEIGKDDPQQGDINYYPVYKSAPWVFCRYNDDLGAIVSTVRANYMPAFKELLATISFDEWIYDSTNKVYKVDFSRNYSLQSQFRVYDNTGEEGIASDIREISIN